MCEFYLCKLSEAISGRINVYLTRITLPWPDPLQASCTCKHSLWTFVKSSRLCTLINCLQHLKSWCWWSLCFVLTQSAVLCHEIQQAKRTRKSVRLTWRLLLSREQPYKNMLLSMKFYCACNKLINDGCQMEINCITSLRGQIFQNHINFLHAYNCSFMVSCSIAWFVSIIIVVSYGSTHCSHSSHNCCFNPGVVALVADKLKR